MTTTPATGRHSPVDRRRFLSGAWLDDGALRAATPAAHSEIVTLHVHARPDRIGDVERELESIGSRRISRSSSTKLCVDFSLSEAFDLATILSKITAVSGVLTATIVGTGSPEANA